MAAWSKVVADLRSHWNDPFYRNSYYLILNTLVVAGSGFIFWALVARVAVPSEVGRASAAVAILMFLATLAKLGMDISLLRFLPAVKEGEAGRILDTALTLTAIGSILASLVFLLGTPFWASELVAMRDNPFFAVGTVVLTVMWTAASLLDLAFTSRRRSDYALAKNTIHALARVALLLALAPIFHAPGIVLAAIGSVSIAAGIASVLWLRRAEPGYVPRLRIDPETFRMTFRASASNYAVSLALAIPAAIGPVLVLQRGSAQDAAVFYVLWMIGSVGMIVPTAFGQTLLVELSGTASASARLFGKPFALALAASAGVMVAGWVLLPVFGPYYAQRGFWAIIPFAIAAIPGYVLQARIALLRGQNRYVPLVAGPIVAAASFVGLLFFAVPNMVLAGWAWFAAMTLGAAATFLYHHAPAR